MEARVDDVTVYVRVTGGLYACDSMANVADFGYRR